MVWSTNLSGTPNEEEIDASDKVKTVIRNKSPLKPPKKTASPSKGFEKIGSPDSKLGVVELTAEDRRSDFQDTLNRDKPS